ncbi:hypothetical protein H3R26_00745 [Lactobacillus sp. W8092]|nr:hypothetical protein [Lactobacillus sp. W8092]
MTKTSSESSAQSPVYRRSDPERQALNRQIERTEKSAALKKRLDKAIGIVLALIIVTYLILFLV